MHGLEARAVFMWRFAMKNPLLVPELRAMMEAGDAEALRDFCEVGNSSLVAELVGALSPAEIWQVLRHAPLPLRAEIFSHLELELQVEVIELLGRRDAAQLLAEMSPDDRADLYNDLPEKTREAVLPALAQAEREDIRRLAAYQEDTAGAVMTSDYAFVSEHLTAAQAVDRLREVAPDTETIYYAYVVGENRKLLGLVSLKDLIVARRDAKVGDLMARDLVFARVDEDREEAARKLQQHDLLALPVVDNGGTLVGIITHDDVLDVAEEEATEDFHKGMAIQPLNTTLLRARFGLLYQRRISWLVLLVFVNIFSGAGIAYYEELIESVVALVFFLPLLIDSGGNSGSQAATIVVRSMALGEIKLRDYFRVLFKEVAVAFALGLTMALAVFFLAWWRSGIDVAGVVAISMVAIVFLGSLIGTSLPFILNKLKMDPAAASAPLVTSMADIMGVLIYLTIAQSLLGIVVE